MGTEIREMRRLLEGLRGELGEKEKENREAEKRIQEMVALKEGETEAAQKSILEGY
jgi:hypothetical protein